MATLPNTRHERFAQNFSKGKSATEAMAAAGYSDPRNSTRLTKNNEIKKRVAELQHRDAVRAEITVASLVEELENDRQLAIGRGQAAAAVAATMGKAKITGQQIDRTEIGQPGQFENWSEVQLRKFIATNLEGLCFSVLPSSGIN